MRGIARWPVLAHLSGRLIGLGFRPEHVRTGSAAPDGTPASRAES